MSRLDKLKNTFTALITPFKQVNGELEIDWDNFREFLKFQMDAGVGLTPMGTTGESATVSHEEHRRIVEFVIDEAKKHPKKPFVLAGSGSNNTMEATSLTKFAEDAGADGALVITPYYNKPTQKGLIAHYTAIAEATSIPIVVYNVPSRTGCNILPDTVAELTKLDNIIGYKAASGDIKQIKEVINKTPDDFIVMSGDDSLTYDIMVAGGKGVISVTSNIVPDKVNVMTELISAGKLGEGRAKFDELTELFKILFVETNPGPVKYAAELMNIMPKRMRLPMVPPEPESEEKIKEVLKRLSVI